MNEEELKAGVTAIIQNAADIRWEEAFECAGRIQTLFNQQVHEAVTDTLRKAIAIEDDGHVSTRQYVETLLETMEGEK